MAEAKNPEIEKFLLAKLEAGIKKDVPYSGKFKKMKESLDKQLKSAVDDKDKAKIRQKLFLLNNHMNEINSKFDCLSWRLFSSLNKIQKDIESAVISGGDRSDLTAPAVERSTRTMATKEVLGFDADKLVVRHLLLYQVGRRFEDFNAVGIIGAEGVGKTTLGQSIFAQEEVKERFVLRIWISLSGNPTNKDESLEIAIAKRILLALGVSDEIIDGIRQFAAQDFQNRSNTAINNQPDQPSTSRQPLKKAGSIKKLTRILTKSSTRMKDQPTEIVEGERKLVEDQKGAILAALIHGIRLELMGKRYLIVLDDATEMEKWYKDLSLEVTPGCKLEERLAFAFPKGYGGTVLVIGWPENVVKAMVGGDGSAIHRLLPLEDPALCWKICEEEAEGDGQDQTSDDKKKVEDEVVKRSNGLPAAARLMGKITKESIKKKKNQQPATSTINEAGVAV